MPLVPPPHRAMILAAGRGLRLAQLTATTPKPLLRVGGTALIDLAREQLQAAGVTEFVVNAHHLAESFANCWRSTTTPS